MESANALAAVRSVRLRNFSKSSSSPARNTRNDRPIRATWAAELQCARPVRHYRSGGRPHLADLRTTRPDACSQTTAINHYRGSLPQRRGEGRPAARCLLGRDLTRSAVSG